MSDITIHPLGLNSATVDALAALIVETVAGGGSVSFMHPFAMDDARTFWRGSLAAALIPKAVKAVKHSRYSSSF